MALERSGARAMMRKDGGFNKMKLDQDQVRTIILDIEEHWPAGHTSLLIARNHRAEYLPTVELEDRELAEYMVCLYEAGFVRGEVIKDLSGGFDFQLDGLTWDGHEFAQNARDDTIWNDMKEKTAKAAGSVSLSIISAVLKETIMGRLPL